MAFGQMLLLWSSELTSWWLLELRLWMVSFRKGGWTSSYVSWMSQNKEAKLWRPTPHRPKCLLPGRDGRGRGTEKSTFLENSTSKSQSVTGFEGNYPKKGNRCGLFSHSSFRGFTSQSILGCLLLGLATSFPALLDFCLDGVPPWCDLPLLSFPRHFGTRGFSRSSLVRLLLLCHFGYVTLKLTTG